MSSCDEELPQADTASEGSRDNDSILALRRQYESATDRLAALLAEQDSLGDRGTNSKRRKEIGEEINRQIQLCHTFDRSLTHRVAAQPHVDPVAQIAPARVPESGQQSRIRARDLPKFRCGPTSIEEPT